MVLNSIQIRKKLEKNQSPSFALSKIRRIKSFHVVILQKTAKKCTKSYNARAQPCFCSLNRLFGGVRRCRDGLFLNFSNLPLSSNKGHVTRGNFSCNLQRSKRCVASCKKKFTCNTPFCNCNCCVASCKKSRTTLYFSQLCETSCLRVTSPLQLEMFFIRHRCVLSCKKNCLV